MLSLPPILTAAATGLVVGIIQAVTQVQEQTISTAPKIILVFTIIIFGGGVMMTMITNYIRESMVIAFNEIPHRDQHILPPMTQDERTMRIQGFFGDSQHPFTAKATARRGKLGQTGLNQSDTSTSDGVAAVSVEANQQYQPNITERAYLRKQQ